MLTQGQSDLLARMREANRQSGPPFATLDHWERVHQEFDGWFDAFGIGVVEEQAYNCHYASYPPSYSAYWCYAAYMNPRYYNPDNTKCYSDACHLLYDIVKGKDRWGLLNRVETGLPPDATRYIVIEGKRYSWDVLISLDSLLYIAARWPRILEGPCLVADLGAGWGRMGFVLKQANPQVTYVDFDLPESLLIASEYLSTIMPGERFHLYDDTRDVPIERDGGVWLLPAQDLALVPDGAIDCFVNIASFQEMTKEYIDLYSDIIHRKTRGVFYSLQANDRYFFQRWPATGDNISWYNAYWEHLYEVGQ